MNTKTMVVVAFVVVIFIAAISAILLVPKGGEALTTPTPTSTLTPTPTPTQPETTTTAPSFNITGWQVTINENYTPTIEFTYETDAKDTLVAKLIDPVGIEIKAITLSPDATRNSIEMASAPLRTPAAGTYRLVVRHLDEKIFEKSFTFSGARVSIGEVSIDWEYDYLTQAYTAENVRIKFVNDGDLPAFIDAIEGEINGRRVGSESVLEWIEPGSETCSIQPLLWSCGVGNFAITIRAESIAGEVLAERTTTGTLEEPPKPRFELENWRVVGTSIEFNYLTEEPVDAVLINPEGEETDRIWLSPEENLGSISMGTPIPGTYRMVVKYYNEQIAEKTFAFQGPQVWIGNVLLGWSYSEFWEKYQLENISIELRNTGDLPAYVDEIRGEIGGEEVFSKWVGQWVEPGRIFISWEEWRGYTLAAGNYTLTVSARGDEKVLAERAVTIQVPTTTPSENEQPATSENLTIHFIDVGQGDAIYIRTPSGADILVDGGTRDAGPTVAAYLTALGVDDIELMVATHPDSDHIGGLISVLGAFAVEEVWESGYVSGTSTYADFQSAVEAEGCPVNYPRRGETLEIDPYLQVKILNPPETLYSGSNASNKNSITMEINFCKFSLLLTGDIDAGVEYDILNSGFQVASTILKVAHHGSAYSSTYEFLSAVSPEVAVISVGAENPYGHPAQQTLDALASVGAEVYRTDLNGTIVVETDGITYTVSVQKESTSSPTPTPTPTPGANVVISYVHYDAEGDDRYNLNDEYVVITNNGDAPADMTGWTLSDAANHVYTFPNGFTLAAGANVTVHTGSGANTSDHLYWGSGAPIWNNDHDTAYLRNGNGDLVDSRSW